MSFEHVNWLAVLAATATWAVKLEDLEVGDLGLS